VGGVVDVVDVSVVILVVFVGLSREAAALVVVVAVYREAVVLVVVVGVVVVRVVFVNSSASSMPSLDGVVATIGAHDDVVHAPLASPRLGAVDVVDVAVIDVVSVAEEAVAVELVAVAVVVVVGRGDDVDDVDVDDVVVVEEVPPNGVSSAGLEQKSTSGA